MEEVISEDFFLLLCGRHLLFEREIDGGKLGDMRVMKICYEYCGDWEREVLEDK